MLIVGHPALAPPCYNSRSTSQHTTRIVRMPDLPTGTVTFLFTDIEGSTTRWERQPQIMQAALARHDAILREAIEEHGGVVFKTVGDAFYAVFMTASDALRA